MDFFTKEQPFNFGKGYIKNPTVQFHREQLASLKAEDNEREHSVWEPVYWTDEHCAVWMTLLDIVEWYREGGLEKDSLEVWAEIYAETKDNNKANTAMQAYEEFVNEKFNFVIKHRGWLWT